MSDTTDTPETDAINLEELESFEIRYDLMRDLARKLERERDELLRSHRELSELVERAWSGMIIGKPIRKRALEVPSKFSEK